MTMSVRFEKRSFKRTYVFRISKWRQTEASQVLVTLSSDGVTGRGEASGNYMTGETVETMMADLSKISASIASGRTVESVLAELPPGGTKNALDCALWDFTAKKSGAPSFSKAGLSGLRAIESAYTIGLSSPDEMAQIAKAAGDHRILKIKMDRDRHLDVLAAVKQARPDAIFYVDANEAWPMEQLIALTPQLHAQGVVLIEQPVSVSSDRALLGYESAIPLVADESCVDRSSLSQLQGLYTGINIKLDKCGGLTEALALAHAAKSQGFKVMVGCNGGTSLAIAPATIVAQFADWADLDSPKLLVEPEGPKAAYVDGWIQPVSRDIWG